MKFLPIFILLLILHGFFGQEIDGRIFDGTETSEDEFPWMVSVRFHDPRQQNSTTNICGGSIISDIFVLTAASCFFNASQYSYGFSIKAGIHNIINGNEEKEQLRSIAYIIEHPNYNSIRFLNDLALVRVTSPFNLKTINVNTISLSNLTSVENMDLVTIGWGVLNPLNPTIAATILQKVTVREDVECTKNKMSNSTTQLCASGKTYLLHYVRCSMKMNQNFFFA
jgi:secreted trypsin-like serine protease